jgi:hypothetical protein
MPINNNPALNEVQVGNNVLVEYTPYGVAQGHIHKVYFNSGLTGGTFRIRVNGRWTNNITFNTVVATLVTNMQTAIDAIGTDILAVGELTVSGTVVTEITISSGTKQRLYDIEVENVALLPNTIATPFTHVATQRGAKTIVLSNYMTSFNFTIDEETVDVTALADKWMKSIHTVSKGSFSLSAMGTINPELDQIFQLGRTYGKYSIYTPDKVTGATFMEFYGMNTSFEKQFPQNDKVTIDVSGDMYGNFITPPATLYKA